MQPVCRHPRSSSTTRRGAPFICMPASPFVTASSIFPTPLQLASSAPSMGPARMSALLVKAVAALVAMAAVAELAAAKNYTIQWSQSGNYGDWSSNNAVSVGDTVVFTYIPPHTVNELPSEADYRACSFDDSVLSDQSGNTVVTFDKAGTRYFACAAGSHCSQGQKVAITAAAPGASPAPKPKENSAAASMAGAAGLAVKLALGLGVGGAVLAAF